MNLKQFTLLELLDFHFLMNSYSEKLHKSCTVQERYPVTIQRLTQTVWFKERSYVALIVKKIVILICMIMIKNI